MGAAFVLAFRDRRRRDDTMRCFLIQAAVYGPAYIAGRLLGEQVGHEFLLGWIIGGPALILAQRLERAHG